MRDFLGFYAIILGIMTIFGVIFSPTIFIIEYLKEVSNPLIVFTFAFLAVPLSLLLGFGAAFHFLEYTLEKFK